MDQALVIKYFNGQCTRSEAEQVLEWFQSPEGQQFLDDEIDQDLRFFDEFGEGLEDPELDSQQLFSQIRDDQSATPVDKAIDDRTSRTRWKSAAAVLLIIGILSLFVGFYAGDWDAPKIVQTDAGEQETILLPDSSKIVLHSNSKIKYLASFDKREVSLEGEAYFEVEHNEEKPFIVYADRSYVKVLGTKFVVSSYSSSERVEVAVKSGRVELGLHNKNEEIKELEVLSPKEGKGKPIEIVDDQVGVQQRNSNPFITDSAYSDELFDWVEGMIIFRDTPLKHVLTELENRYGVECVLGDSELAKQKLTSSFSDESLEEVLHVLTLSLDIEYQRVGNKIYFSD